MNWLVHHSPLIVLMPFVLYFATSALFLSIRDNIGSSDALKKIFTLSKNHLKKIYTSSLIFLIIAWLGDWALNYRAEFILSNLPFNFNFYFIILTLERLLDVCLLVFLQIAVTLLFGHVESDATRVGANHEIEEEN